MNSPSTQTRRIRLAKGTSGSKRVVATVSLAVIGLSVFSMRALADSDNGQLPGHGASRRLSPTKTDGKIQMLRKAYRAGESLSRLGRHAASMVSQAGEINITVTYDHELSEMEIDFYEEAGVRFMRIEGHGMANYGRFYPAWVSDAALLALNDDPSVVYLSAGGPLDSLPTMDQSIPEIQADIRHRTPTGTHAFGNQGEGVVIANFDTGIDIHHPDFFYPRTGLTYDWIDDDDNGMFSPLLDCVDLNRNDACDANERLGLETFPNAGGVRFDPKKDWLYNDANTNGGRDYGTADGFSEVDESYGETIFITYDANGNNTLDFGEKLTPLGESKVRAMLTADPNGTTREYRRGQDLIQTPIDPDGHGTSVSSILVAGDHGYNRSFIGVAPDAELLVIDRVASNNYIFNMQWAKANGADVILWEFGAWTNHFLDGSSPVEQAISADMESGECFHVTPNGNLAASNRHAQIDLSGVGDSETLTLSVPADKSLGNIRLTVLWEGADDDVSLEIKHAQTSAFTPIQVPALPTFNAPDGAVYMMFEGTLSQSPRGTSRYDAKIVRQGGSLEASTSWNLRVQSQNGFNGRVHLFVADDVTQWSGGVYWNTAATSAATLTWPATADTTLNVGSYSVSALPGQLSAFSGRGPRIDGVPTPLDITAPGHYDIACATSSHGFLWAAGTPIFGGTSAAGPHAAAAAALLLSAVPDATPLQIAESMTATAAIDGFTGPVYNDDWGYGKLRVDDAYHYLAQQQCPGITLSQISPADGAIELDPTSVVYSWSDHPEADRYDLYVGKENPPTTLLANLVVSSLPTGTLEPATTYYWQLFGRNTCGYTASTSVMQFTTAGVDEPEINVVFDGNPLAVNDTVTFPTTEAGEASERLLVIENTGNAPLTLTGLPDAATLTGDAAVFSVVSALNTTMAPLDPQDLLIRFAPSASGTYEALLTIPNDDADENPFLIQLSATASAQPLMVVTALDANGPTIIEAQPATTISFADADLEETSELSFQIRNEGNGPLALQGDPLVQLAGDNPEDFSVVVQPADNTIAPTGQAEFRLAFAPTTNGTRTATVHIASNDPLSGTLTFTVSGFGIEAQPIEDCNTNGQEDLLDIAIGQSPDCNGNLQPDECEADADGDGVIDDCDQCPGDDDRSDLDLDGVADCLDNCPLIANADQMDFDNNGVGNACQIDQIIDDCNNNGVKDSADIATGQSGDCDSNGIPDECQQDQDADGIIDACDRCPQGSDGQDADGDQVSDCLDNCPAVFNPDQGDGNGNGVGDACEPGQVISGTRACGAGGMALLPIMTLGLLGIRSSRTPRRRSK